MKYDPVLIWTTEVFGYDHQFHHFHEEMAELMVVVNHYRRGKATREDVIKEMADVEIMLGQLGALFGISETEVDAAADAAIEEVKRRVEKERKRLLENAQSED